MCFQYIFVYLHFTIVISIAATADTVFNTSNAAKRIH